MALVDFSVAKTGGFRQTLLARGENCLFFRMVGFGFEILAGNEVLLKQKLTGFDSKIWWRGNRRFFEKSAKIQRFFQKKSGNTDMGPLMSANGMLMTQILLRGNSPSKYNSAVGGWREFPRLSVDSPFLERRWSPDPEARDCRKGFLVLCFYTIFLKSNFVQFLCTILCK